MLVLKAVALLLAGVANCLLALLVLARDPRKFNTVSFFVLSLSVGGWALGIVGFLLAHHLLWVWLWVKIYYSFPLLISCAVVYFAFSFPGRNHSAIAPFWQIFAPLGLLVNLVPLLVHKTYLTRAIVYHSWGKEVVLGTPEYALYSVYLLTCFLGALYVLYRRSYSLDGIYAKQARLFFFGFSFSAIFGVTFNLILPIFGNYRLVWAGPLFTAVLGGVIAVNIVRHKMFDIRWAVTRVLAYVTTLAVLASIFGSLVFGVATLVFDLHFSVAFQIFVSAATAVAALGFAGLKKFFDKVTTKLFYHDAYDPQALVDKLNRLFVANTNLERLLRNSAQIIEDTFKAEFCLVGVKETEHSAQRIIGTGDRHFSQADINMARSITPHVRQKVIMVDDLPAQYDNLRQLLSKNGIAVLGRLTSSVTQPAEGLGYLALGPRKSGNPYNSSDRRILEIIVNELVIAVENSLRFEEIDNFNLTLQQKVHEATHQLRQTNSKLKQLDETKDEFISMASHQLRTPLTSVKGYLSMVLEGDAGRLNANQRKLLEQSYASSQRMVYLISDLLNLSRLNTGKFVIEPSPVNLSDIVQDEVNQLAETAKSRELELVYNRPANFPQLMLDETKIHQVVMNLIDNAIYYTPAGGTVTVALRETPAAVEYTVHDTGIGVPKAVQHKLFTKFYRAANAQQARPDGTGLGLFMAKKVVVAQGGSIIFESEQGKGSTFGFRFSKAGHAVPHAPQPGLQPAANQLVQH